MSNKLEYEKIYSLSPMQEGMLFHSLYNKNSKAYFEQMDYTIEGDLDLDVFKKSFEILVEKHEALRTMFVHQVTKKPKQIVLKKREAVVHYEDISLMEEVKKAEYIENYENKLMEKGFDLTKDVLIKLSVIKINDSLYRIVWNYHHIILDGWSVGILIKEFFMIYNQIINGVSVDEGIEFQYSSYIQWLEKQDKAEAQKYWKEYLEGYGQAVDLPKSNSRKNVEDYYHKEVTFSFDQHTTDGLKDVAQKAGVTINTVFQSIWGVILGIMSNTDDVVFGSVVSGRPPEIDGIESMVGLFINTIPIRINYENGMPFSQFLKQVQTKALQSEKYDFVQLAQIQKSTGFDGGLFNSIIAFENYPIESELENPDNLSSEGFSIRDVEVFEETNYNFCIIAGIGEVLTVKIVFNGNAYSDNTIARIKKFFRAISMQIVSNPEVSVGQLELLDQSEKEKILSEFNNTECDYQSKQTIHQMFKEQVAKTPDSIAVIYKRESLTYKELDEKSEKLAFLLREKGVVPDSIVGIMVKRSLEMIIGILGILKAGGAYLPIDPQYPEDRVMYVLKDSNTELLLTTSDFKNKSFSMSSDVVFIDDEKIYIGEKICLDYVNKATDLAYIIYTSGSTGKPKGVMIEHTSAVNTLNSLQRKYPFNENDTYLLKTAYTFDVSVAEIFGWFFEGGRLAILEQGFEREPLKIIEAVKNYNVTHINFVPSMFNEFVNILNEKDIEAIGSLKHVFLAGEAVLPESIRNFYNICKNIKLENIYGPTESTIYATSYSLNNYDGGINVPIGKPLHNTEAYIVDKYNKLVPIGVPGELCLSGAGLARGYFNNEKLTNEKFINNPFRDGKRMYKTGDLAVWTYDGNIEFLGRIDNQVKIRGFRIELGEIEAHIAEHPNVKEALVVDKADLDGNKYLCAYIVAQTGFEPSILREYLLKKLPEYMVPTYYTIIESIPHTTSGKVDRRALVQINDRVLKREEYKEPQNELEYLLASIFEDVLGIDNIGIEDSFFSLGGDSIKAIQVASRLYKNGFKMDIKELFDNPKISQLSKHIKSIGKNIDQSPEEGEVILTPIQRWFFESVLNEPHHFNHSFIFFNEEGFDEQAVRKAFEKIIVHHDALRMIFKKEDSKIVQYNRGLDDELYSLDVFDFTNENDVLKELNGELNIKEIVEEKAQKIQASIDLEKGPLARLGLFKTNEGQHLLIVLHHLVVDGISWRILFEDLATAYIQAIKKIEIELPQKTNSFREWAKKLNEYANSKEMLKELDYWKKVESTIIQPIPVDYDIEEDKVVDGIYQTIKVSKENTDKLLKNINKAYNTEINDILLTALGYAISSWSKDSKVLINLEGHGREEILKDIDITRTVGWFTTSYPVVLDFSKSDDISYQIKSIKEGLRGIPKKGIGYGILKYITAKENKEGFEIKLKPEICFNYLGQFDDALDTDIFSISNYKSGNEISLFSNRLFTLDINGMILNDELVMNLKYNKKQYKEETIVSLCKLFERSLLDIIDHCQGKEKTEITPSDVGKVNMSIDQLNDLVGEVADLDDDL